MKKVNILWKKWISYEKSEYENSGIWYIKWTCYKKSEYLMKKVNMNIRVFGTLNELVIRGSLKNMAKICSLW